MSSEQLSSSSDKTPLAQSRKNKESMGSASTKKQKQQEDPLRERLVKNVEDVGNTLATLTAADIRVQINRIKNEVLGLQERKLTNGSMNEALVKLYDTLIEEKQNLITTLEGALQSVESRPKTLQFNMPTS